MSFSLTSAGFGPFQQGHGGSRRHRSGRGLRAPGAGALWACSSAAGLGATACFASANNSLPGPQARRPSRPLRPGEFGHPARRATDTLMVLNLACFAAQWFTRDAITMWGAKINHLLLAGQYWRFITPVFLHSSLIHLAVNCYALNNLGPAVESLGGRRRYIAVYLASAVAGTAASLAFTPAPSLGASGAIFGLGSALGVFYWRHRELLGGRSEAVLRQLGTTLAINMVYSLASRRIDNWGHAGGLLGGAAVAWLLGPRLVVGPKGQTEDRPPWPVLAYPRER